MVSRRTVLVGLGATVAGGGALIATGAFTTVEAERTLTLETASDDDAFLGLQIRDDLAVDDADMIAMDFDEAPGFNLQAFTRLDKVLLVTNNGTQEDVEVTFEVESVAGSSDSSYDDVFDFVENNDDDFDDGDGGVSPDGLPLNPGDSAAFDLELELRESHLTGDAATWAAGLEAEDDFDIVITITAEVDS